MLKNHLKVAIRYLFKNRLVTSINILGLGLGLTISIFILLFVTSEFSYDQWIPEKENIYRIYRTVNKGESGWLTTPSPVAAALREEVPGVVAATRNLEGDGVLATWKKQYYSIPHAAHVDSLFFETFPLAFKYGNRQALSTLKDQVVLSEQLAKRIFGEQNPVGEIITINNEKQVPIAGVLMPPAGPSHLRADIFIIEDLFQTAWTGGGGTTYIRLSPQVNPSTVEKALFKIAEREIDKEFQTAGIANDGSYSHEWKLQPLIDIHLNSTHLGEKESHHGSSWQIKLLVLIGLLVLLLASINYINLVTAQTGTRAKEIGVRTVTGASRSQLIGQLLMESLVVSGLALVAAVFFAQLLFPFFNEVISRTLSIQDLFSGMIPFYLVALAGVVGVVSGIFPALYLSSLRPAQSLKANFFNDKKTSPYRNALIVFQFALSIGMVLFITIIWQQVNFALDKELGFAGDQIAVFKINQSAIEATFPRQKSRFLQIPGVEAVSQCANDPGRFTSNNWGMDVEGIEKTIYCNLQLSDLDWNEVFQIPVTAGRFFSTAHPMDSTNAFVVNQAFVKKYGLTNPVGHRMKLSYKDTYSTIIGVIEDFHYQGLQNQIKPLAILPRMNELWMSRVAIRFKPEQTADVLAAVSNQWKRIEPGFPVDYRFLDDAFAEQYDTHIRFSKSMTYAAIICLLIALSGLFGLTVFIIQRKTKEIGVRKVLGASIISIVGLLSKDFLKPVFLALLLATPIAWYFAEEWLANFAYRITIQPWVFLLAGVAIISLAFFTLGWQSIRAAIRNPVEALRNE